MTPVHSVAHIHKDASVSVVQAESHISIQKVIYVVGFQFLAGQNCFVDQVRSTDKRNVPKTPAKQMFFIIFNCITVEAYYLSYLVKFIFVCLFQPKTVQLMFAKNGKIKLHSRYLLCSLVFVRTQIGMPFSSYCNRKLRNAI